MASYSKEERRAFLQLYVPRLPDFVQIFDTDKRSFSATGAPKLPIGGFKGLHPQFTVVRKPHEPPLKPDQYLPSVMTCAQVCDMRVTFGRSSNIFFLFPRSTSKCLNTAQRKCLGRKLTRPCGKARTLSCCHRSSNGTRLYPYHSYGRCYMIHTLTYSETGRIYAPCTPRTRM